jgi:hypothetical protein
MKMALTVEEKQTQDATDMHPKLPPVYGSPEHIAQMQLEEAQRPKVLPLNQRHYYTPAELDEIRRNPEAFLANKPRR